MGWQTLEINMATGARKNRGITVRLTEVLAAQLDRAVAWSGRTQSELITEAIADKTGEILREQHYLELSERDMAVLLDAIANPPEPTAAMRRAVARWRELGAP